jgi:hypothetical protein
MRFHEIIKEGYKEVKVKFSSDTTSENIQEYFEKFRDLVNRDQVKGDQKNIDWWGRQGWNEFKKFVDEKSEQKSMKQLKRSKIQGNFHVIQDDDEWLIIVPLNKDASCYFGKNTKWCVTKRFATHFEEYFYESFIVLIYFIKKETNQKWAMADYFFKEDKVEYFDVNDKIIPEDKFLEQTGLEPSLLDEIDDSVRFGEIKELALGAIEDYEYKSAKLYDAIDLLDTNEQSDKIEYQIIELGNITLMEKYLELFENPTQFSNAFTKFIFNASVTYIRYIANPSVEMQMKAIEDRYHNLTYIKNPHPQVQMYYAQYVDDVFEYNFKINIRKIKDEAAQIELIQRVPSYIGNLANPSVKVQIAAVSTSGSSIMEIENPSKEVQMAAVKNDPFSLSHIKYPHPEVIKAAIQEDPRSIQGIENPSYEIQKMAIDIDPFVLGRIKNPDPEIRKYANEMMKK